MLFTPATVLLFAKQAVVKQVLAVHTSTIEQLKHATDTSMQPLPSQCIACTDRLFHRHPLRLVFFFFLFIFVVINGSFFPFQNFRNIKNARLLFFVERRKVATRKIVYFCLSLKKIKFQVPSSLSRKPCEEAHMYPGWQYTIRGCSSILYIFYCSGIKKVPARNGSTCS